MSKSNNYVSQLNFWGKSKIFGMEVDNGHINAHWSELRSETLNKKVVNILRIFFRKKNRRKKNAITPVPFNFRQNFIIFGMNLVNGYIKPYNKVISWEMKHIGEINFTK